MAAVDRRELLKAVRGLLEPLKGPRQLEVFPDSSAEFLQRHMKSQHGAILVSYAGGRSGKGGEARKPREFALDVVVLSRGLNGDNDALATVQLVEDGLDGRRVTVAGLGLDLTYVSDRFAGEVDNTWQYVCRITATEL